MRKRVLALFLAFAMVLGMMPAAAFPVSASETVTPPFTSITTEDGEAVSYSYKGAIPAATTWQKYEDGPYYHVTIPQGTESVLVTYPADVGIAGAPSAFSYTLSVPDYELGYGSATFAVATNDDGSKTVTIPVADYLLTDGTGTAMSLEAEGSFDPITFFSFAYGEATGGEPEPSASEEPHTCVFDQQVASEDYLATAADCTHAATYYDSCTCGKAGTETFSHGEALGHSYANNICTRCDNVLLWQGAGKPYNRAYLDTVEMTGATAVSAKYSVNTEAKEIQVDVVVDAKTASDEELTFHLTQLGDYGLIVYYKDADEDTYSSSLSFTGVDQPRTNELAKRLKDGSLSFSLKASWSGTTWYWHINITTEHVCAFDQQVVNETYLATKADCTNAATYYYSCTCGAKGTTTFSDGEALGHNYENGVCTRCGKESFNGLAALSILSNNAIKTPKPYKVEPAFDPAVKEYTVYVPERTNVIYIKGTVADDLPTAFYVDYTNTSGVKTQTGYPSGVTTPKIIKQLVKTGYGETDFTVTVYDNNKDKDVYSFHVVRVPSLTELKLGELTLDPYFYSAGYEYTATTSEESVAVTATPYSEDYSVTINGTNGTTNTIALKKAETVIEVAVENEDGKQSIYTITVTKPTIDVTFTVNVEDPEITVTDADGATVEASDGVYKLLPGVDYTYTVKKDGYEDKTGTINLEVAGTVEVQLEKAAVNALSALSFHSTYSANDTDYVLSPEFAPATKEYTLLVHDSKNACYAKATLAEGVEGTITAAWVNRNTDEEKTQAITSGKTSGQTLTGAVKSGNYKNTVTITVTGEDGEAIDTYTVNIVRTPSLTALALDGIKLNETFLTTTTAYTASTAADSVTVAATPRDEGYTVTVNGGEDTTVALSMGENVIPVVVKNEDGYETAYTITVTRKESIAISFSVNVDNPRITMTDANKTVVTPVDGVYTLISGETYSYTVQCDGYIGQTNSFSLTESGTIEIELEAATANPNLNTNISAEWANFRNGPNHLGITDAATPYAPEDAELLWAAKYGTGWSAAPGSPIIVDGDIITYVGSTIKRLDKNTGKIKAEGTMVGSSSYSIVPATYADGMIFVGLSGGRIQAFNAATLESLWVYTDELKGQPNCPITYKDGYIYAGFWNSETKDANFVCIYTIDEDHDNTTESKLASWKYTRAGGFYWAGAYVSDKFAVVGTDDGASGYTTEGASLLVFDRFTGDLVDSYNGLRGDIRSNVSYDPSSDRVFFTSKGGILCNAKVDWSTGRISDFHQVVIQDANGNANAMSTCTPSVYNDRIYIGVCGTSQFGDNSGHGIAVYDLNADGSMTRAYTYAIKGYPQTSAMVTTAYADTQEGYVYIYLPYNSTPGGISVLKDKKGQTEPMTTTDEGYSEVFTPVSPLAQYCICSTIADQYGTIYYKNDSCYMMAITSRIESLELETEPTFTVNEDGEWSYTGLKAVTHQVNGTTRDVTEYVDVAYDTETGAYSVSYTYGFDNDNYGLKTLTVYSVTLPEGDGYTVKGETTANSWEPYTFTVDTLATFEKTDAFAVKVNGEAIEPNEDGSYTVKEVSGSLTITVEGLEAITLNITVYYADNGTIVVGDDTEKTLLNFAPVTVTDANGDGKFTMYDGFYCFHEQYHANGAAGYTDSNWVTQFWSVETAMVSYGKNNRWVFSTADEITDGDSLCLYTYQDQYTFSDLYTYFDNLTTTATANEEASFHVNGYSFFGSGTNMDAIANPVGATVTATCGDKTLTTTTDDEGNFKLTFPSAGEWTILVNGKCSYTCDVGYYKGQTYTDAPVTPAMMTVTVEEAAYVAPDPIQVYMYYATKSTGIVAGKDGTLLNYVPITVTDGDMDGILTMSDAFYALHETYYEGGADSGYQNGKYTMKFWGKNLSYGQFERNGSNDNIFADTAIEAGDMLAVLGGYGYNCLWTHFEGGMDGLKATAATGEETTFYVTAYQANGTVGNVTLPEGANVTATCGDTTLTTTVNANGAFTLTFPGDGIYTVLVDGTSTVNGVKCGVIPAMMTVTAKTMSYSVTLPQGEGFTVTGETTAAAGEDYTFTVTITDGNEYVVKVNGKTVTPDDSGTYTVANVSEALVITVTEFSKIPQQDTDGTYLIENGYQLKWFADQVNGGEYAIDGRLVDNIDLSVVCSETLGSWTPIGNYKDNASYQGNFDGQGYTISNLYMKETGSGTDVSTYYRGLFGQAQCGSIKNVNLTGTIHTTLRFVGGLVGRAGALAGGLDIENCHVDVDIVSDSILGAVGGIAGTFRKGTISNCSFSGSIQTGMRTSAGGIVGEVDYESGMVSGCLFDGSIESTGGYNKDYGVGGIAGVADTGTYTIENCASLGRISASLLTVGGILGNQRKADVTITGCYNAGTADASGVVGGILGQITNTGLTTTVTSCYYLNTFADTDAADGSARTAEEMKSNTMVMLLGDGFKRSNGTVNGGYPGLSWQKYDAPALPESLAVTLTSGTGYTLSGDPLVAKGDSYTVTIDIELGYETDDTYAIKANGVAMTANDDGSFTLASATEALIITAEGVVQSANAPVNITLTPGDGYTLTGETRVAYGTDYTFTLALAEDYGKSGSFAVKANGAALPASEDGSYTIANLTEDLVITVEGVLPSYTVKVNTSDAYTLSAYEGYVAPSKSGVTLLSDQDYKFIVTPNEGYAVRDNNYGISSGTNVNISYEVVDDHAVVTVSYNKGNGTISITGVKKIMQVTLPEETGYTIVPGEDVADMVLKGETYTFTLKLADGYQFGNGAAVKAGDTVLTANDQGVYSFKVNADTAITVTGVEEIPTILYTVTLPEGGDSIVTAVSGYSNSVRPGGTFQFTVEPAVGYEPGDNLVVKAGDETLTAVNGVYTLENIMGDVTITVAGMEAIHWDPVTVYLSISHDDKYLAGKESKEVMALRKISVPYFDLGLYGLEKFYFSSETYGSDGGAHSSNLTPGTAQYAYGKITLLHLYIYSLEVYYCGLDESAAGKGYLKEQNLLGTDVLTITGSRGSLYMTQFWGGDENLNYYVNYQYPLASAGWGSTSDQILLRENDVITLGHFTSWSFFNDPSSIFNYLTPDEANQVYGTTTVTQGDQLTLTAYRAGNGMSGNYTTGHSVLTCQPTIYYTEYDDVDADFAEWTTLGTANADGTIVFDTTNLEPGTYVVAMAGRYGSGDLANVICSTPGGILVVVEEKEDVTLGDLTGDGEVKLADVMKLYSYLNGKTELTEEQLAAADVNDDGKVDTKDAMKLYAYCNGKIETLN